MGKAIVISGTPGVGKTRVATKLVSIIHAKYINLSNFVLNNKLYIEYDEDRDTYVIDEDRLRSIINRIVEEAEGYIVIDSHYGEIIDDRILEKIFILRLHPKILMERLRSRGWSKDKVKENVEAELLGICTYNALKEHPPTKVCEVDVTNKEVDEIIKEILSILHGKRKCAVFVDWLLRDNVSEVLNYLTRM